MTPFEEWWEKMLDEQIPVEDPFQPLAKAAWNAAIDHAIEVAKESTELEPYFIAHDLSGKIADEIAKLREG